MQTHQSKERGKNLKGKQMLGKSQQKERKKSQNNDNCHKCKDFSSLIKDRCSIRVKGKKFSIMLSTKICKSLQKG